MSDKASLAETVTEAITGWCSENAEGFPMGFVIALEYIQGDGRPAILVTEMDNQPTHRSMGMASWLKSWYQDDAEALFRQVWEDLEED